VTSTLRPPVARYDPVAADYERLITTVRADHHTGVAALATALVGHPLRPGRRRLVDLGCGPGVVSEVFRPEWHVTGVDLSTELLQLARAAGRLDRAVHADAIATPLAQGCADAVVSTYTHTDVDDWPALVAEGARLLTACGVFAYVGAHPCFVGPHAEHTAAGLVHHPGYYHAGQLRFAGPGLPPPERGGLRSRVGVHHRSLTELLAPFTDPAAWRAWRLTENDDDPPTLLGVRVVRR
jgi:SAM-dependent methyltransferase